MNALFLINGILGLVIFFFLVVRFFIDQDKKSVGRVMRVMIVVGFVYLVLSLMSLFWFFNYLEYSLTDYTLIYTIAILVQNLILFRVVSFFSKNKKLYYLLGLYLLSIPLMILVTHSATVLFLLVSYLFSILVFADFALRDDIYAKVGYAGILYSVVSLILSLLTFLDVGSIYTFSFISTLIFGYAIYLFVNDLENYSIVPPKFKYNDKSYFFRLLEHLIFIVIITNFVFIGTIAIHEAGHFGASTMYDCDYQRIVFEEGLFHTEVLCGSDGINFAVTLGGVLLPILVAVLLFFIGGKFMTEIGFLMIGFNLLAISRDLAQIGFSQNFGLISMFVGGFFLILGVYNLAKSKTEDEIYSVDSFELNGGFSK